MRTARALLVLGALVAVLVGPTPAFADAKCFTDASGDASSALDLVEICHGNTAERITYRLRMASGFDNPNTAAISISLNLKGSEFPFEAFMDVFFLNGELGVEVFRNPTEQELSDLLPSSAQPPDRVEPVSDGRWPDSVVSELEIRRRLMYERMLATHAELLASVGLEADASADAPADVRPSVAGRPDVLLGQDIGDLQEQLGGLRLPGAEPAASHDAGSDVITVSLAIEPLRGIGLGTEGERYEYVIETNTEGAQDKAPVGALFLHDISSVGAIDTSAAAQAPPGDADDASAAEGTGEAASASRSTDGPLPSSGDPIRTLWALVAVLTSLGSALIVAERLQKRRWRASGPVWELAAR